MTPERLKFLIDQCFRRRRKAALTAHHQDIAAFLHVSPVTLRRWLAGIRPIPPMAEIILEIFYAWPEITADAVLDVIRRRDEESKP